MGAAHLVEASRSVGASCWVQVSPLPMLAQVGAVREGVDGGGEYVCRDPLRQIDHLRPQMGRQEGKAGGVMQN